MYLDFTCSSFAYKYSETSPQIDAAAAWIEGREQTYIDDNLSIVLSNAFSSRTLTKVGLLNCSILQSAAFYRCYNLSEAYFPKCSIVGQYAFCNCISLQLINLPQCTKVSSYGFFGCGLNIISLPQCTYIDQSAFCQCNTLSKLYLLASTVCSIYNIDVFSNTPISKSTYLGYYGSIYVPASLLNSYKTATNWTYYSNRLIGV